MIPVILFLSGQAKLLILKEIYYYCPYVLTYLYYKYINIYYIGGEGEIKINNYLKLNKNKIKTLFFYVRT